MTVRDQVMRRRKDFSRKQLRQWLGHRAKKKTPQRWHLMKVTMPEISSVMICLISTSSTTSGSRSSMNTIRGKC